MKKILISILTLITALCCFGVAACNEQQKTDATLVDFTDVSVSYEYGDLYVVKSYVYDTDGKSYKLNAKVTDADGETVEHQGSFVIVSTSYSVVYSVDFNGATEKQTVTVTAGSKPVITMDRTEHTFNLGLLPYEIPEIAVTDAIDGEITTVVKEIYFETVTGDEKTDYNGTDATFMPDKLGTYYLKVTATNSQGVTNTVKVRFSTRTPGAINFIPSEETASKYTYGEYVTNDQLPTDVDNTVGYVGDAIKSVQKSGIISFIDLNFSATEYQAMADRGDFNSVTFSYLIKAPSTVTNNEGTGNYAGLLTQAGVTGKSPNSAPINAWQTVTIKIEDFCKAMRVGDTDESTLLFSRIWTQAEAPEIYIGNIEFIWKDPILLDIESCSPAVTLQQKNGNSWNATKATLVKKEDLPVSGYDGDAIKLNVGSNWFVYATLNYTLSEIQKLTEKYESATINILFTDDDGQRTPIEGVFVAENIAVNAWMKAVVPLATLMDAIGRGENMSGDRNESNLLLLTRGWNNGNLNVYLGDITLNLKKEFRDPILLEVDYADATTSLTQIYNGNWNNTKAITCTNEQLPTNDGYKGSALKINVGSQWCVYAALNYTKTELETLKDRYESATINILFTDDDGNRSQTEGVFSGTIVTGLWQRKTLTLDELATYMGIGELNGDPDAENLLLITKGWNNGKFDIYLGDITLNLKKEFRDPTLLDVFYANAGTTLTQHNGAWNKTEATYVANNALPVRDGYDGDAMQMSVGSQYYVYVKLNYTKAQIETLKNDYSGAVINVMFTDDDGNRSLNDGVFQSGITNTWMQKTLTLDELQSFMGIGSGATENVDEDDKLCLLKCWNNGSLNVYVGDITLVKK